MTFGTLVDIASFLFFNYYFQNKQNFKISNEVPRSRATYLLYEKIEEILLPTQFITENKKLSM